MVANRVRELRDRAWLSVYEQARLSWHKSTTLFASDWRFYLAPTLTGHLLHWSLTLAAGKLWGQTNHAFRREYHTRTSVTFSNLTLHPNILSIGKHFHGRYDSTHTNRRGRKTHGTQTAFPGYKAQSSRPLLQVRVSKNPLHDSPSPQPNLLCGWHP